MGLCSAEMTLESNQLQQFPGCAARRAALCHAYWRQAAGSEAAASSTPSARSSAFLAS